MASWSKSSLAGPLRISYPIKSPPAHAFQLQSEIYCPGAGLIQQDTAAGTAATEGAEAEVKLQATNVREKWMY